MRTASRALGISAIGALSLGLVVAACGPEAASKVDGATGGVGGGDGGSGGGGTGGGGSGGGGGADAGGGVPTYDGEIKALFALKCGECHGPGGAGMAFAANYAGTQGMAMNAVCMGKKIGACTIDRIKRGEMPLLAGCRNNPMGAKCVTPAQQAQIEAWIAGGMRER